MSQTNWYEDQNDAYTDLAEDGAMFTFSRRQKGKPDPITGEMADTYSETFTAPGIFKLSGTGYTWSTGRSSAMQSMIDQGLVQVGDEVLLVAAKTYVPKLEDRVIVGEETWVLKAISSLRPGIVPILHYLVIRKG